MREQDKTPENQLNEVEIGNLPEKEFKILIVKRIQDLGKTMEAKIRKMQEMFNKDLEELKNKQAWCFVTTWRGRIGRVERREMQEGRDMGTYVYV